MNAPQTTVCTVIHAAAGTGKTHALTAQIVRLLLDGADPHAVLAITFTNKAANEMHQRVMASARALLTHNDAALADALTQLGYDTATPTRIQAARSLYEKLLAAPYPLRTTTFHAFCHELLHRFALEAELAPGFELVEDTGELRRTAWLALEREARTDEDLQHALKTLIEASAGIVTLQSILNQFLDFRSDWWAYTENDSDPVAGARARLRTQMRLDADDPCAVLTQAHWREKLQRYSTLLMQHPLATHTEQAQWLEAACDSSRGLAQRWDFVARALLTVKRERRKTSTKLLALLTPAEAAEFTQLSGDIAAQTEFALAHLAAARNYDTSCHWYLVGARLLHHYQRLKAEANVLDFADLEWKTYKLLHHGQHAQWVQYKLDARIDHILIDEFQDTNPTQWRLLLPLLQEIVAGDPARVRSVFIVGDDKQSIYRFRRAQPELFDTASQWLQAHAGTTAIAQTASWRSSPAIIELVNILFTDGAHIASFQRHSTHRRELWGEVTVLPAIVADDASEDTGSNDNNNEAIDAVATLRDPLREPRAVNEDRRYRHEAERMAATIRAWVGRRGIADGGGARALRYADVMVLMRERTHAYHYEDALRRADIPYAGVSRALLRECLEVDDVLNLLRWCLSPDDDYRLAAVLKSPIFGASDADLSALALATRASSGTTWWRVLNGDTVAVSAACVRAATLLPMWLARADTVPVHDFLDSIYCDGNLLARYRHAAPLHLRKRIEANLTRLVSLALDNDSGRYPSLARFIHFLDHATLPAADSGADENCVRLLTLHAAKGLEAPVVFLVDAARPAQDDAGMRAVIDWPSHAERPTHFFLAGRKDDHDPLTQRTLAQHTAAQRREDFNLLYVALTRAKQVLVVSGCQPRKGTRGWYDTIWPRLSAATPTDGTVEVLTDGAWRLHYGAPPELIQTPAPLAAAATTVDMRLSRPLSDTPRDLFVTPSETSADTASPTAQTRGRAVHRALQLGTRVRAWEQISAALDAEFSTLAPTVRAACVHEARALIEDENLREWFDAHRYDRAENELPILYRDAGREVYGVIDRLVFRSGEICLLDYKTQAPATDDELDSLSARYAAQLRLYARGVQRAWPTYTVRALLLFTGNRRVAEIALGE